VRKSFCLHLELIAGVCLPSATLHIAEHAHYPRAKYMYVASLIIIYHIIILISRVVTNKAAYKYSCLVWDVDNHIFLPAEYTVRSPHQARTYTLGYPTIGSIALWRGTFFLGL